MNYNVFYHASYISWIKSEKQDFLFWGKRPLWWNRGLYSLCLKGPAQGRGIHFDEGWPLTSSYWSLSKGNGTSKPRNHWAVGCVWVTSHDIHFLATEICFVPRLFRVHWCGKWQILMTIYLHKWPPIFQQKPISSSVLKNIQLNEIWLTFDSFDLIDLPLQGISAMEVYDFSAQREECLGNGLIAMWWLFSGHDIPWVWYTMIRSKDMKQSWLCCCCLPHLVAVVTATCPGRT